MMGEGSDTGDLLDTKGEQNMKCMVLKHNSFQFLYEFDTMCSI